MNNIILSNHALVFRTRMDIPNDEHAQEQYQTGLQIGKEYAKFHIAVNRVWSASKPGSCCFSSEKLGYHRATAEFFQGILDSGIEIIDHRD